jgi:ubiquinone/menaquinone biosynthesis C-methylase UbiE
MSNDDLDVNEIMNTIKLKLQNNEKNQDNLSLENLISFSSESNKERIKIILDEDSSRSREFEYIQSLNINTNDKIFLDHENGLKNELRFANESVNIQTFNKIDTSKPALVKKFVLKIRYLLQNEIRFALDPIINNQIKFNTHIVRSVNETTAKLDQTIAKLDQTTAKLDQTIAKIIDIEKTIQINEISRAYNELLNREPSDNEITEFYLDLVNKKFKLESIRNQFKQSQEYSNLQEDLKFQHLMIIKKINERKKYLEILESKRQKDAPNAISFVDFDKIVESNTNSFSERNTEYLWVLSNLPTLGKLLDVGCLDSEFANELTKIKGLEVFGVDIRTATQNLSYKFKQEDATVLSFDNNYFDFITLISSIEHFGLNVYGGKINSKADMQAIAEIKRIIKPTGKIFLTVPFGKHSKSWSRVYDSNSLSLLLTDFIILEEKYFEQQDFGWIETTKQLAEINEGAKFRKDEESSGCIACVIAKVK